MKPYTMNAIQPYIPLSHAACSGLGMARPERSPLHKRLANGGELGMRFVSAYGPATRSAGPNAPMAGKATSTSITLTPKKNSENILDCSIGGSSPGIERSDRTGLKVKLLICHEYHSRRGSQPDNWASKTVVGVSLLPGNVTTVDRPARR